MKLVKLTLENFRAHQHYELEFQPGVVGVLGSNGSGKSSLLEGLYYAITGGGINGETHSAQLRWGAKKGHTRLRFSVDEDMYVLTRKIGGRIATLEKEGGEKLVGIQAVNAQMSAFLGTSLDHLREMLFVPQESLDAPLRGTDAVRKEAFGRLFGCARFESLRNLLQEGVSRLSDDEDEDSLMKQGQELTRLHSAAKEALEAAKNAVTTLQQEIPASNPQELMRVLTSLTESQMLAEEESLLTRMEELLTALKEYREEETKGWDRKKTADDLAHWNAVLTLFSTGVCPVCRLSGGNVGCTEDEARGNRDRAREELGRMDQFDYLATQLIDVEDKEAALRARPVVTDEEHAAARRSLEQREEAERKLREAHSSLGAATAQLAHVEQAIAQHQAKVSEYRRKRGVVDVLVKVRECFHRDALQQDLRAYGVDLINQWLRDMLSIFTIPYSVYFDNDGLLRFTQPGSEEIHDFMELSGGQRKLVALAYRLALMRLFMGNLGLAVLDEPTPFIDKGNIAAMQEAFKSLNRVSLQKGITVLVATHEESLFPAFTQLISMSPQ